MVSPVPRYILFKIPHAFITSRIGTTVHFRPFQTILHHARSRSLDGYCLTKSLGCSERLDEPCSNLMRHWQSLKSEQSPFERVDTAEPSSDGCSPRLDDAFRRNRSYSPAYSTSGFDVIEYKNGSRSDSSSIGSLYIKQQFSICGVLEKRGYWNPAWKIRFFVLTHSGDLHYFRSRHDAEGSSTRPRGTIRVALPDGTPDKNALALATRVRARPAGADGRFPIELDVRAVRSRRPLRTFVLSARSEKEQARWLAALRCAAGWEVWEGPAAAGSRGLSDLGCNAEDHAG